jgi:hypothetical protein
VTPATPPRQQVRHLNRSPFARVEDERRPLTLVLDEGSLDEDDLRLLLMLADEPEIELIGTGEGSSRPRRLEIASVEQDIVHIHEFSPAGVAIFGVYGTAAALTAEARRVASESDVDDGTVWRALVMSAASREWADGLVTAGRFCSAARTGHTAWKTRSHWPGCFCGFAETPASGRTFGHSGAESLTFIGCSHAR